MSKTHNAGIVTAYGAAVRGGYTGTYEEFCAQQAQYAENARQMEQAVSDVRDIKTSVESAVSIAETHANNANTSATNASNSATQASESASNANQSAESASQFADNASSSANSASQSAASAQTSATNASASEQNARQSAEDAQDILESVQTEGDTQINRVQAKGQEVLDSIPEDFTEVQKEISEINGSLGDVKADLEEDVNDLKSAIKDYNTYPVSNEFFTKTSGTHNGVTYTWSTDGTCTLTGGTTTNPSVNNLYYNPTALPNGIEVNHTYYIKYKTTNENVRLSFAIYKSDSSVAYYNYTADDSITLPTNTVGLQVRLYVSAGITLTNPVTVTVIDILDRTSTYQRIIKLEDDTISLKSNYKNAGKYVAFGDSLVWGSVWSQTQGTAYHQVKKEWRIPTRIARALDRLDNYDNQGVGGIGYITKISNRNIVDMVKAYTFTGTELITIEAGVNDYAQTLGSFEMSTANDGTICGAILEIISYVKTNYPKVQIIFIQPTPFSYSATDIWNVRATGGWSINDFETQVSKICKKNEVGYISWHGCTYIDTWISSSGGYNDQTGPNYSHPVTDSDYLILGDYLAGKVFSSVYGVLPSLKNDSDNKSETIHVSGNGIKVSNASQVPFKHVSLSGDGQNTKITVSNKNLFWQDYLNTSLVSNGVTFGFDKVNSRIRVYSSTGATGNAFSATDALGTKFQKVNNVTWWHNFKVCFGEDTIVTFSGNMSKKMPYDSKIRFDIYDGSLQFSDDGNGVTFIAKAGREYGFRIVVLSGWSGDVYFYPQLEVGSYATELEPHFGGVFPSSEGADNIFRLTNTALYNYITNGITFLYDRSYNEIHIEANPSTANTITNYSTTTTVNGVTWNHIFKWTSAGETVWVSGIPKSLLGKVRAQVSDGTNTWLDYGYGISIDTVSGTEYAYRLYILADQYIDGTVKPVIATNANAIKMCGGKNGITNIFANDSTEIKAEVYLQNNEEKLENAVSASDRFNILTGFKTPFTRIKKRKPMVSFIDDDTTSIALVQRYHTVMASKGVVGGFAVETKNLDNNEGLPALLLDYEQEGYACLYHCYYQSGDATRYWEENNPAYNKTLIKENFMRGLRSIRDYGFSKYNHWVTPYGVNGDFIQALARNHGMESLMTMGMTFSDCGYMSIHGNVDRYNIPRVTLNKNVDDKKMHALLEGCVADNGWIIFMTHANTWTSDPITKTNYDGTSTTYSNEDAYIAHVVQQCLDLNMDVVPYTEAFEWFKPVFYLNELL